MSTWGPSPRATGVVGSLTIAGSVHGLEHPRRGHAGALERLGGGRQGRRQLERGQWDESQNGEQRAVQRAGVGGVDAERQGPPAGQPGQRGRQSEADAGGTGAAPRHPAQLAVRVLDAVQLSADRPHDEELGRALHEIHHARREFAPHGGLPGLLAAGKAPGQPGHGRGGEDEGHQQDETGLREEPPQGRHRASADERRHQERLQYPQHHVLQRVHVVDEARHEVAPAEDREAGGGHRFEPFEDTHAEVGQHAQRGVVAPQPLAVAEEPPREPEELHPHDGQREMRPRTGAGRPARSARPTSP